MNSACKIDGYNKWRGLEQIVMGRNEETDIKRTAGYEGKYKMTKSLNLGELCCRLWVSNFSYDQNIFPYSNLDWFQKKKKKSPAP